jgi:two-component system response regulator CssR
VSHKIYLVEDEENLKDILRTYLERSGFIVTSFSNGESALRAVEEKPSLWILDIMLPDVDGFQLLKEIKKCDNNTPVIFISARDNDIDRIIGLEMGSDDYISKPFLPRELVIRTQKLLERTYKSNNDNSRSEILVDGYEINITKRNVISRDEEIGLTSKEFDLLLLLIGKKGGALTREQILNDLWGDDYFGSDRVVDDLVRRLRKKLPELKVETLYGYGYRLSS